MEGSLNAPEEDEVRRLMQAVAAWANLLADAPVGSIVMMLAAGDEIRGKMTVTNYILSELPVQVVDMFGSIPHNTHGFGMYTSFMRDALEVVGKELQIPTLLRDRFDLKLMGCSETLKAFQRWDIEERLDYVVQYPCWWGIPELQAHAHNALSDALEEFMSADDFASYVHEKRVAWAKDWWAAHPEKREEMSQRFIDWWAAHPEKREEKSKRQKELEAACAPGSCSYLHADPEWQSRFREATSKRWEENIEYRAKMIALSKGERPKLQATMLLKWQDDAFRTMMLSSQHRNLEARRVKNERETSALILRFERGEMTAAEKQQVLHLRAMRERGRQSRATPQPTPTHASSDALAAMIDAYYDARPEERLSDELMVATSPETMEARKAAAEREKLRREALQKNPRALDETRSSAVKRGWSTITPEQKLARTANSFCSTNQAVLDADKAFEGKVHGDLSPVERLELVRKYQMRVIMRKKKEHKNVNTPHSDALAEAVLAWWGEDPARKKADQMANRQEGPTQEAKSQLELFRRGELPAEERWAIKQKGDGRHYQRKKKGATCQDSPEVAEIYELILGFYAEKPSVEVADRAAFERMKKRKLAEKTGEGTSSSSNAAP